MNIIQDSKLFEVSALLFDMDCTLVNSTSAIARVWGQFALRHNLDKELVLSYLHGRRMEEIIQKFAPKCDLIGEANLILSQELADAHGTVALDGALDLLNQLHGEKWAIVTSASRKLAIHRLTLANLPIPDILIAAEDVVAGKPAPEGYQLAAEKLNVPASECLVFEDADAGLWAAAAAGMRAIAVDAGHSLGAPYCKSIVNYTDIKIEKFYQQGESVKIKIYF